LVAAMSFGPAQGGISLTNDRITFGGELGPTRPSNKYVPGDIFFLSFDIEGLKPDPQGKVEYLIGMTVTDAQGKVAYKDEPSEQTLQLPLGAAKVPARAFFGLGLDLRGAYTCKVTVIDKASNVGKSIEKQFEVGAPDFAIVCFHTTYDDKGTLPAPLFGVPG